MLRMEEGDASLPARNFFAAVFASEKNAKYIFGFLGGADLARAREVSSEWNELASAEHLWQALCLKICNALGTDEHLWPLITPSIARDSRTRWRQMYPLVKAVPQWNVRLQKTGKFLGNIVAHQIKGPTISGAGLPSVVNVERRFNTLHLKTFVLPEAAFLYFEPKQESDSAGFNHFIQYLSRANRAGLALENERRFILIPPCEYTRTCVEYQGQSLIGVVQTAYPPLAP